MFYIQISSSLHLYQKSLFLEQKITQRYTNEHCVEWNSQPLMRCLYHNASYMALGSIWKSRWKFCQIQRWWTILWKNNFQIQQGRCTQEVTESVTACERFHKFTPDQSQREISYSVWAQIPSPDQDSIHSLQLLGEENQFSAI